MVKSFKIKYNRRIYPYLHPSVRIQYLPHQKKEVTLALFSDVDRWAGSFLAENPGETTCDVFSIMACPRARGVVVVDPHHQEAFHRWARRHRSHACAARRDRSASAQPTIPHIDLDIIDVLPGRLFGNHWGRRLHQSAHRIRPPWYQGDAPPNKFHNWDHTRNPCHDSWQYVHFAYRPLANLALLRHLDGVDIPLRFDLYNMLNLCHQCELNLDMDRWECRCCKWHSHSEAETYSPCGSMQSKEQCHAVAYSLLATSL